MAGVPPTPTLMAHRWAAFMLLVVLGLQLILWGHILMTILILIILTCAPLGGLMLCGLALPIVEILTSPTGMITSPGPGLGILSSG